MARQTRWRLSLFFILLPTLLLGSGVTIRAIVIPVTATWNANPEPDIAGYKLSYGTSSGNYTTTVDVGNVTSYSLPLVTGQTYYFVVQAYNTAGLVSAYSSEMPFTASSGPTITGLSPNSGLVGTNTTITGTGFGATKGTSTVTFNGTTASPTSWSATSIVVPVPAGATSGGVVVTVGGIVSNSSTFTVTVAPTLTNVSPTSGPVGTAVTIAGTNFGASQGSSTVKFNGTTATPTSWSSTSIMVPVPSGATSGNVVVTVAGLASNGLPFTVAPHLTNLSPSSGPIATAVTIAGSNFGATQGSSTVRFNGTTATPTSWSSTSIVVTVPSGATSGNVVVTVGGVASNGLPYTVAVAPSLTSLTPTGGPIGTAVTITGTNFGATQSSSTVKFNGTTATPTSWSATSIVVPVPNGATTGNVVVTVSGLASNGLPYAVPPTLTNLSPNSGPVGTSITVTGTNFGATKGSSTITFSGTSATPTSWSMTSIVVPVPAGTTTGNVVVTVGGVASNGLPYTVTVAPSLTSVAPASGPVGTSITITGANFGATKGSSTVKFNGTTGTPTSWSNTSIVVPVPNSATTGNVVVTVGGLTSNGLPYTVTVAPSLTSLSPTSGVVGTSVTINGANFGSTKGSSTVTFNGTTATPTSWSSTSIVVPVPNGATTGNVVVTVGGVASNGLPYTVAVAPTLTSLTPTGGSIGTAVTITGTNFGATQGSSTVKFNGTTATPTSWSATSIVVPVPNGASTGNVVVTVAGLASNGLPYAVTPTLTNLSPNSGPVGTSITVTGTNFGATKGSSTISFNGTTATPTSWSMTSIVVPVPSGATSGNVVVTVGGVATNGLPFTVTVAPGLTSLSPTNGPIGTSITISGANFGATKGSSTVKFNGTTATPTSWSNTSIVVPVPNSATTGNVVVTVGGLASNGLPYTVTVAPSLTSLSPTSGVVGTSVTINGTNFGSTKGSSTVTFNGTAATPTTWSSTRIVVPVPAGASTGSVVVTVNGLASNSLPYTVLIAPSVTSVNPSSAQAGAVVTIAGAHFGATKGSSTVTFNGTPATPTSWSDTSIAVPVPGPATSGNVVVTVGSLVGNGVGFTVLPASLTGTPNQVAAGGTVAVAWAGIGVPTSMDWVEVVPTGSPDTGFVSWSYTTGASSGSMNVTMPMVPGSYNFRLLANNGWTRLAVSSPVTVQAPGPILTNLSPNGGPVGTAVTISGANFGATKGTSTVTFNGTNATPSSWSATSIVVPVPAGATTGSVMVTVAGVASNALPYTVAVPPSLTNLSPTSGPVGTSVTLSGANFGATKGTSSVTFNGTPATPASWSATSIVVPVPAGATSGNVVVTVGGMATNGIAFTVSATPITLTSTPSQVTPGGSVTVTWSGISTPTSTDWIAVVPTGAPDTSYASYQYTTGTSSGSISMTMPTTMGTYDVHLLANNGYVRLAASNPVTVQSAATPTLTSVAPVSGPVGTSVTIAGANFGSSKGSSTVRFNGTSATPSSWSSTSIVVPVPGGATTGNVVVTVGGVASNGLPYTVTAAPSLTSVSPTSGPVGTSVTLTGANFGASKGTSTVTFNGTSANPTSWSATSIVVPVPAGATTGNVVVTVGGLASNGVTYTVNGSVTLTSVAPSSGTVGTVVTLTGTNFGATKGI